MIPCRLPLLRALFVVKKAKLRCWDLSERSVVGCVSLDFSAYGLESWTRKTVGKFYALNTYENGPNALLWSESRLSMFKRTACFLQNHVPGLNRLAVLSFVKQSFFQT